MIAPRALVRQPSASSHPPGSFVSKSSKYWSALPSFEIGRWRRSWAVAAIVPGPLATSADSGHSISIADAFDEKPRSSAWTVGKGSGYTSGGSAITVAHHHNKDVHALGNIIRSCASESVSTRASGGELYFPPEVLIKERVCPSQIVSAQRLTLTGTFKRRAYIGPLHHLSISPIPRQPVQLGES